MEVQLSMLRKDYVSRKFALQNSLNIGHLGNICKHITSIFVGACAEKCLGR